MANENDVLRDWKAIEEYAQMTRFGLKRNGYPLRREKCKSVYALKSELDAFIRRNETADAFSKKHENQQK